MATKENRRTSVCMATYNGERFVQEQVNSILPQLAPTDELVIVDDASTDGTVQALQEIRDPRIRLILSPYNRGHVKAFESAVAASTGDLICLSDQDDLWTPGRLVTMQIELESADMVATNFGILGSEACDGRRLLPRQATSRLRNIVAIYTGRIPYLGCAMAFRSELKATYLPFPSSTEAHDLWLALLANFGYKVSHLPDISVNRRIHANNLTPIRRRALFPAAKTRILFTVQIIHIIVRFSRLRLLR